MKVTGSQWQHMTSVTVSIMPMPDILTTDCLITFASIPPKLHDKQPYTKARAPTMGEVCGFRVAAAVRGARRSYRSTVPVAVPANISG